MKKRFKNIAIVMFVIAIVVFNIVSLYRASKRETNVTQPKINEYAMTIYGKIEPFGKAVSVSPKVNGIITEVYVQEGDTVRKEQPLCALENTAQDNSTGISYVTSPKDGLVYKSDIHAGESFVIGDSNRIIIGSPELQICCDVDILWIGKLSKTKAYEVFNAETMEAIGTAVFRSASRYLRPKTIQTEEPAERFSSDYQEVIMKFEPSIPDLPINLPVMLKTRDN